MEYRYLLGEAASSSIETIQLWIRVALLLLGDMYQLMLLLKPTARSILAYIYELQTSDVVKVEMASLAVAVSYLFGKRILIPFLKRVVGKARRWGQRKMQEIYVIAVSLIPHLLVLVPGVLLVKYLPSFSDILALLTMAIQVAYVLPGILQTDKFYAVLQENRLINRKEMVSRLKFWIVWGFLMMAFQLKEIAETLYRVFGFFLRQSVNLQLPGNLQSYLCIVLAWLQISGSDVAYDLLRPYLLRFCHLQSVIISKFGLFSKILPLLGMNYENADQFRSLLLDILFLLPILPLLMLPRLFTRLAFLYSGLLLPILRSSYKLEITLATESSSLNRHTADLLLPQLQFWSLFALPYLFLEESDMTLVSFLNWMPFYNQILILWVVLLHLSGSRLLWRHLHAPLHLIRRLLPSFSAPSVNS